MADPGIGTAFERPLGRVLGKDGKFQVERKSAVGGFLDGFTELTTMSVGRLLFTIFLGYFFLNAIFACLYFCSNMICF